MSDDVDIEDPLDFWNSYDWNWESAADVKQFIEDAVEREVYEYAWGALSEIGEENFYTNWWYPVQNAIKLMATNFSKEELNLSIKYLLEGDNGESDPSILDALIKHVPGFPEEYPEFDHFIDELLPEDFYSDWWEFTWYPFVDRYFTWTFWAPETLARSENVNPLYLRRIFRTSITSDHSYKTFRARVALATNPKCPSEIIDFLFENRNKPDWLFRDAKEEGIRTRRLRVNGLPNHRNRDIAD